MTEYRQYQEGFEKDLEVGEVSRIFVLSIPVASAGPYPKYWQAKRYDQDENGYAWSLYDSTEKCIRRGWADSLKAAHIAVKDWAADLE